MPCVQAFDCVSDRAVEHLSHLTQRMLESSPAWVLQRLQERGAALALAGRDQGITGTLGWCQSRRAAGGYERPIDGPIGGLLRSEHLCQLRQPVHSLSSVSRLQAVEVCRQVNLCQPQILTG